MKRSGERIVKNETYSGCSDDENVVQSASERLKVKKYLKEWCGFKFQYVRLIGQNYASGDKKHSLKEPKFDRPSYWTKNRQKVSASNRILFTNQLLLPAQVFTYSLSMNLYQFMLLMNAF